MRHVDYIAERIGVDHVAFGSDFEGADGAGRARRHRRAAAARRGARARAATTTRRSRRSRTATGCACSARRGAAWGRYFDLAGDDPRPTLLDALDRFAAPGLAVDLGAGTGRDTAELLRRGWSVIAIDGEPEAIERLHALVGGPSRARLETRVGRFEEASGRTATS